MLQQLIYILAIILVIIGLFAIVSGIMGVLRFSDFFCKLHGAGVIDSFGVPVTLLGISLIQENIWLTMKIWLMIILLFVVNPLITHMLSRAAILYKIDLKKKK